MELDWNVTCWMGLCPAKLTTLTVGSHGLVEGFIVVGLFSDTSLIESLPEVIALSILHPAATISAKLVAVMPNKMGEVGLLQGVDESEC